jgi:hypothetical protein
MIMENVIGDQSGDGEMSAISVRDPSRRPARAESSITSLVIDVAIPLAIYYLLHDGLGVSLVTAMAASSVIPAARALHAAIRDHALNQLAALMLGLNVASIVVSLISGDARLLFAREAAVSSVIGIGALATVLAGRTPMFAPAVEAFMTRGERHREQAWSHLVRTDRRFAAMLRRHTLIWGVVLLADCAVRVVCAYTMPVADLAWLSTAITVVSISLAMVVSGAAYGEKLQRALAAELER